MQAIQFGQHTNGSLRGAEWSSSNCEQRIIPLTSVLFLILLMTFNSLPLNAAPVGERNTPLSLSTNRVSLGIQALDGSTDSISITVNCKDALGAIPPLFLGHYDVDPTRTGVGLNDTTGTSLMKEAKLGFWRLSIGRWEIFDYPSNEDIQKREYFRGSTLEDTNNNSMYCWEHMDKVFSSVLEFNCIPLICVDYMPASIANNTSPSPSPIPEYTFPNGIRNSPPKNITVFAEVIRHVVMHYTQGWPNGGGHYYDFAYWEVWNEPELPIFWTGTFDVLCQMYGAIVQAIRSIDTTANQLSYKIGGLSFATPGYTTDPGSVKPFLSYCRTNNITLDFLSWHGYPDNPLNLTLASLNMRKELQKQGFNNTLNILAEWGTTLFNSRPYWDSSYYAAFTSLVLSELENSGFVDYQTHSCIKDREVVNFTGGYWGILSRNPTRPKPTYFVFKAFDMLNETCNRLGLTLTSPDQPSTSGQGVIAGKSSDGTTITLIYSNFNNLTKMVSVGFHNLSWPRDWMINYNHYLIDNQTGLGLTETSRTARSGDLAELTVSFMATPYTVHVFRLTIEKLNDLLPALVILAATTVAVAFMVMLIVIDQKRIKAEKMRRTP